MVKGMGDMLSTISKKLLSTFLRSAFAVMLALRSKYWDRDLLEKTTAMLLDANTESKPPLAERLHEIPCPVLIVTGDNDRLVPSWNTERLSQAIPGSCLEVVKQCGHLPHEEKVKSLFLLLTSFCRGLSGVHRSNRLCKLHLSILIVAEDHSSCFKQISWIYRERVGLQNASSIHVIESR